MADAVAVAVAKAVLVDLAAASLSQEITPQRSYFNWHQDRAVKEEEGLSVDVGIVTTQQTSELSTRGGKVFYEIPIDIAVRKALGTCDTDDETGQIELEKIDPLMLLVQEIYELFIKATLTTFDEAVWRETRILTAPLTSHLIKLRQFTGVVRITFGIHKAT